MIRNNMNGKRTKFFTEGELSNFFETLENNVLSLQKSNPYNLGIAIRNNALFKLMYYCASRVSEITTMKVTDYDQNKKEIFCTRSKGGIDNTLEIIDQSVIDALNMHLEFNHPRYYLFENLSKNRIGLGLSRKTLHTWMHKYCKLAGILDTSKWHCHALRHTRAVNLADQDLDVRQIQYWLGHADVSNTQIYLCFTTKQYNTMYKKLLDLEKEE